MLKEFYPYMFPINSVLQTGKIQPLLWWECYLLPGQAFHFSVWVLFASNFNPGLGERARWWWHARGCIPLDGGWEVPGEGVASSHTRQSVAVAATSVKEASGEPEGSNFSVSFPSIRKCPAYSPEYASWHKKPIEVVHSTDVLVVKLLKQALG